VIFSKNSQIKFLVTLFFAKPILKTGLLTNAYFARIYQFSIVGDA
jgi:hypothetical protein